ncbi:J domain-containing protein [Marinilabilia sp.]|jgi:DnaJ-class molecular chaperone|uniref:J domain-containing protein n=1 Tax=Marinilabilia sp. TaxID=2021252 RepID=UPI0025B8D2CC|nr:J domain-containing protein [Marinilabilia sp.]
MNYFQNTTDLEQAKQRYRTLAKELHPDKGGSALRFQQMQEEYKTLLLDLQREQAVPTGQNSFQQSDIMAELGKLAKVLIQKQVPQQYLQEKIKKSQSPLEKSLFSKLVDFLNELEIK